MSLFFSEICPDYGDFLLKPVGCRRAFIEAKGWEISYQCPRKQDGRIPASVLETWEEYVSDSSRDLAARLFARAFKVALEAGLRWGGLINTAPSAKVLLGDGLIGFAAKTQTRGKSEGRPRASRLYAFPNKKWLRTG